jgi:hypothetical protein
MSYLGKVMEQNDYYNTSVPKEVLEAKNNAISARWKELSEFYLKYSDEMIKYLLYVNAGGAATSIGFMGASEAIRSSTCLRIALLCFALGLASVGILRALLVHKIKYLFDNWRKDAEKYWSNRMAYTELTENDDKRSESGFYAFVVGYISGGFFILGLIFGAIGLFSY